MGGGFLVQLYHDPFSDSRRLAPRPPAPGLDFRLLFFGGDRRRGVRQSLPAGRRP